MASLKGLYAALAIFFFGCPLANLKVGSLFHWRFPPLTDLSPSDDYMADLGAVMLGSHRIAADIAYVQLLQYYGQQKGDEDDHNRFEKGNFPLLKEKAQRILRLDPFFNEAVIEASGALAFIEKDFPASLDLLREAIDRDPTYYRYHLYMTAILYKNTGEDEKLIEKLEEAMRFPDCPPLLQSVLGNLLRKVGRNDEAARVYIHTYRTAPSNADRQTALHRLGSLIDAHPELAPRIQSEIGEK